MKISIKNAVWTVSGRPEQIVEGIVLEIRVLTIREHQEVLSIPSIELSY